MVTKWLALVSLIELFCQISADVKCIHDGKEFQPGEQIPKNCNRCYCLQHGNWLCTQRTCKLKDLKGILLTPSNNVMIQHGSKLYVICRSERRISRFLWFVNGQHFTSPSKVSTILQYGESVLRLNARDLRRKNTYVTCFAPPFTPKRIKVTVAHALNLPTGMPKIKPQPKVIESSPNFGVNLKCSADGLRPHQVTWFKFGVPLRSDVPGNALMKLIITPDGTLIIPSPVKSDSGLYECMVTNDVGIATSSHAIELVINKGLPVKGGWCGWKLISENCNASCGGYLNYTRECACPAPKHGGSYCLGSNYKTEPCSDNQCYKEVYGEVNVDTMKSEDVLRGSCLHIAYLPHVGRKLEDDCQASSVMTLRDFRIHEGTYINHIKYKFKLPRNLEGKFRFVAILQLGHCQEKLSAIRKLEKACVNKLGPTLDDGVVDLTNSSRIRVNINAHFEEKPQILHSVANLRPKIKELPSGSCLKILIWTDEICHGPGGCQPLQILQVHKPKVEDSKIVTNTPMVFALDKGSYQVKGILNIGWCSKDSEKGIDRDEDYVTREKKYFSVDEMATEIQIELTMDKVKEVEKKRGLPVKGGWCEWKLKSENCNASCGGYLNYTRECACPAPKHGGSYCLGSNYKTEPCSDNQCYKEVYGEVNVDTMKSEDVLRGSCLHIAYLPHGGRKLEEDCQASSVMTLRDFRIHEGTYINHIKYKFKLPRNLEGKFRFVAILQLGHCQEKLSAIRKLEKACVNKLGPTLDDGVVDLTNSSRIRVNINAHFEEKPQILHSVANLRPKIKELPSGSCLKILIWTDEICHGPGGCQPLQILQVHKPKVEDSKIVTNTPMVFALDKGSYQVEGILNIGWCSKNSEKGVDRKGDYVTLEKRYLFVDEMATEIQIELTMDKVKEVEKKRDLLLTGDVKFEGYTSLSIPPASCLIVELREIYKCNQSEGCRRPYTSEKRVKLSNEPLSRFPYSVLFRGTLGSKFEVDGYVNIGWCKDFVKGKRKIKVKDYFAVQLHQLHRKDGKVIYQADLEMSESRFPFLLPKRTIHGRIQYKPGLLDNLVESSCMRLILTNAVCSQSESCEQIPFITQTYKDVVGHDNNTIPFRITYRSQKRSSDMYLYTVLNVGWCSEGLREVLRPDDLVSSVKIWERDDMIFVKMKKQSQFEFINTPLRKAELDRGVSELKISLSLPPDFSERILSSSCMVIRIRKEMSCQNKTLCFNKNVVKKVFRDVMKTENNSVIIEMRLKPALKRNTKYQFDIVLNQGWCSEGAKNGSLIKNGDLFNSVEEQFKNGTASVDVIESITLKTFYDDGQKTEKCNIDCPKILNPVCGSDNKTYNSICVLYKESCIFESGVTLLHKGECERCKFGCSTIIDPICARNGKTYDNLCIMKREACFEDSSLAFRHFGKCGSVTMRGDVRFPLDQPHPEVANSSCLIIKIRKAVYCKFPERCPDYELAEVVLKDVIVPKDGKIPYEVVMNPRPMSSVYLVEAVLNQGWCSSESASKEWIRNKDYFNAKEQPFAVQGSEEIFKDIPVAKLVNLKGVEKGTIPSAVRDPCSLVECPFHGNCRMINGKATCRCNLACNMSSDPVCGSDGKTYGNDCIMKSESCLSQKVIEVDYKGVCGKTPSAIRDPCSQVECPFYGNCRVINGKATCRCNLACNMSSDPVCGSDGKTYGNDCIMKSESCLSQKVIEVEYKGVCGKKNALIVEGEVLLDETLSKISNGSCLLLRLHEGNESCQGNCEKQPVVSYYVKDLFVSSKKKIPYRAVIKPRPKPGSYRLSVILNHDWCSEGSTQFLRNGDFVVSEGKELEIRLTGNINKNVEIRKYYLPGMSCKTKDGTIVQNGAKVNSNGKGCQGCRCNNGSIACNPAVCSSLECNKGFLSIEDGDCCPSCVKFAKCHHSESGKRYKYGEKLFNREKGYCETCMCSMSGKFSCSKEVCPKLDCKKPFFVESSCCPVCASDIKCKDRRSGMLYKAGETWSLNGEMNGCAKCKCVVKSGSKQIGFIECIKPNCPQLNCAQQVYPKDYCCPVCLKKKANGPFQEEDVRFLQALIFNEVVSSDVSCSDISTGKIYVEGEKWSHSCMDYECKRSGISSKAKKCPYLTCLPKYHVKKPGDCCASCSLECMPKLVCSSKSMMLIVPKAFLPYTRPTELVFNNCTSSANKTHFILKSALDQCGMKRTIDGDVMKYSNIAYTQEDENAVISRVQLVKIPVSCVYPAYTRRILSREFIKRNRGIPIVTPVTVDAGPVKAFDVYMKIRDEQGVEQKAGEPMKFDPGEKVFVEINGTGLVENKIKVKADHCYLTPTPGPNNVVNYTLIQNGCAKDSTVEFQEQTGNGQRFSFRALVFTNSKIPNFYLHCDTVTCDEEDSNCVTGCRQRRSLYREEAKLITRQKTNERMRSMKLTLHVVLS